MMTRETWERQFTRQLKQQLGLTPEQIRFPWRQYFNQRYSPEGAIADLKLKHELYPQLGLLPETVGAEV
jgi:hypothetical protein